MQEFSSVTASSYDAESLAPLLNEKAADGWSVVSIVAAGTNIVAYLQREASGATAAETPAAETPPPRRPPSRPRSQRPLRLSTSPPVGPAPPMRPQMPRPTPRLPMSPPR